MCIPHSLTKLILDPKSVTMKYDTNQYFLTWYQSTNLMRSSMWPAFYLFQQEQLFCDADIVCSDQTKIPAHRLILAAVSPYFKALFNSPLQHQCNSDATTKTSLAMFTPSTVQLMMDMIYRRHDQLSKENHKDVDYLELMRLCDFLQVRQNFLYI